MERREVRCFRQADRTTAEGRQSLAGAAEE
jgi:hypothetical protein